MTVVTEFDDEPIHGLPAALPEGERVLWQGSPCWDHLAREAFHTRGIAFYFVLLAAWQFGSTLNDGGTLAAAIGAMLWIAVPAAVGLGMLTGLAVAYSRGTVYTVTNRRVVIRSGLALTLAVDIPFTLVNGAALKSYGDGTGDLVLSVNPKERLSWAIMWPNVRPWKLRNPEPMLRVIPEATLVAALLARELRHFAEAEPTIRSAPEQSQHAGTQGMTPALS
ncbi:MAG TPA: photosynthetic complex putative assembly protein PuhB [Pseudomonadales bacterium]|nr:photosynthetic complex putative assembly protein PuhB [Pseudomonadales bacterium]